MRSNFYCLILLTSIVYSCGSRCDYEEGLTLYFEKVIKIDLNKEVAKMNYYIVPLESCESCIYDNLRFLSGLKSKNLIVIFVGENQNKSWNEMITTIRKSLITFDDPQKLIYSYETGLRKPLLVSVDRGKCIHSFTVNETEIVDIFDTLNLDE